MADGATLIESLLASGAAERDPVRFAYLSALIRRAAMQPEATRQALNARIRAAASEIAFCQPPAERENTSAASPLTELLTYINEQAHEQPISEPSTVNRKNSPKSKNASASPRPQGPELKSVAYFRNEWSKLSTEQQLTQTLAQAPENAGPMNSQHLVLRSLERMRDIAPDYLQGFMSYIDTLIWLDHADPAKSQAGRSSGNETEKKPRSTKSGAKKR